MTDTPQTYRQHVLLVVQQSQTFMTGHQIASQTGLTYRQTIDALNALNNISKVASTGRKFHGPVGTCSDRAQGRDCGAGAGESIQRIHFKMTEHDPNGKAPNDPGAKLDAGKQRVWLCVSGFSRALAEVAKVTTAGAIKYSPNGWKHVTNGSERYMDAFGRHMLALGSGEVIDQQTGCRHQAQMIWNLLAALELDLQAQIEQPEIPFTP